MSPEPMPLHPLAPAVEAADGKVVRVADRWLVRTRTFRHEGREVGAEYVAPEDWLELHRSGRLPKETA